MALAIREITLRTAPLASILFFFSGAVNDRVLGIEAGMDIEMPGNNGYNDAKIVSAVREGRLPETELNKTALRVTELVLRGMENRREGYRYDAAAHRRLAVAAAEQSAVLLKNEGGLLPGHPEQRAAVIGAFAKAPRYQGAGSSKLHPLQVENAWDCLTELGLNAEYAPGYDLKPRGFDPIVTTEEERHHEKLLQEACEAASGKDIVYVFAGLPEGYESEGFDREHLRLPKEQNGLIEAICSVNFNVVVILLGGAPMELPWVASVQAILLGYLSGEGGGKAIANLLLGHAVPSGKLAETWPLSIADTPAYSHFPGDRKTVEYRESIYVGYRFYEKAGKAVQFPFGHGLSYSEFRYSDLTIEGDSYSLGDEIEISFRLSNTGKHEAMETALVFVAHRHSTVFHPVKELCQFVKVNVKPGESKRVSVKLDTLRFRYYNTILSDWHAESGQYDILIGPSSQSCPLRSSLELLSPERPQPDDRQSAPGYYDLAEAYSAGGIPQKEFELLYGRKLPESAGEISGPYNACHTLEDVSHTWVGRLIWLYAEWTAKKVTKSQEDQKGMILSMMREMPFYAMVTSGDGMMTERRMEGLLDLLNGKYMRGMQRLIKG